MVASATVVLSLEAVNILSQLANELANLHAAGGGTLTTVIGDVASKTEAATAAALDVVGAPTVDVAPAVGAVEAVAAPATQAVEDAAAKVQTVSADVAATMARQPRAAAAETVVAAAPANVTSSGGPVAVN